MRTENPFVVDGRGLRELSEECGILIVAAGFEARARRVVELLDGRFPRRVVAVQYPRGAIQENDETFEYLSGCLRKSDSTVMEVVLNAGRPDEYLQDLRRVLSRWRPDAKGEVWVDITALPMQGICASLAAVREGLPEMGCRVVYTEAETYLPTEREVKADAARKRPLVALSKEMSTNLIPKKFSGSSSDVLTCLGVFAGYEAHRSLGVVDGLNPSKLLLVFGRPSRGELEWRLSWSQEIHRELMKARPTAEEVVSTLDPMESLTLLNEYYDYLFSDHNVAVAPICSKMQCVGCYLFWERFRDVQLVFPLPITYLPKVFSRGYGQTFVFEVPRASEIARMLPSAFGGVR